MVRVRLLHPQMRLVFMLFFGSQLIAALFTPQPVLAVILTCLRSALLLGLICVGAGLSARHLLWLLPSLFVVYVTAYVDAFLGQRSQSLLSVRLLHPFLTSTSLGLAGAFGALICLSAFRLPLWWRLPLGLLAFSVCVLSGSRAALFGLLVGALIILISQKQRWAALLIGGAAFLVVSSVGNLGQNNTLERFSSISNSDRDLIWSNTISVIAAHPVGGVGPYQLGNSLLPPSQKCELWPSLAERGIQCPAFINTAKGAWLIAHNMMLQQLAEAGIIGALGYALLVGCAALLMLRSQPVLASICAVLLVVSLVDNVLLVPSPFFSEIFWLALGISQRGDSRESEGILPECSQQLVSPSHVLGAALAVLIVFTFPLWTSLSAHRASQSVQLVAASGPRTWSQSTAYPTYVTLKGQGKYRVVVRACLETCRTLGILIANLDTAPRQIWDGWVEQRLPFSKQRPTEIRLELFPLDAPPVAIQPLARKVWLVTEQ